MERVIYNGVEVSMRDDAHLTFIQLNDEGSFQLLLTRGDAGKTHIYGNVLGKGTFDLIRQAFPSLPFRALAPGIDSCLVRFDSNLSAMSQEDYDREIAAVKKVAGLYQKYEGYNFGWLDD